MPILDFKFAGSAQTPLLRSEHMTSLKVTSPIAHAHIKSYCNLLSDVLSSGFPQKSDEEYESFDNSTYDGKKI